MSEISRVLLGGSSDNYVSNKNDATSLLNVDSKTINLGTEASAKALTLGNTTSTTSVTVNAGTGGINLSTNAGSSETIVVTNSQGTSSGAIALTATSGGITASVADEKDLTLGNAAGDAYFKVAASATNASEDVRIVNTNGTDAAAIALTASAGGITMAAGGDVAITANSGNGNVDITGSAVISGNLTVNGTTTTLTTTNTVISDNMIELNTGLSGTNSNDSGILIERGSTGDNAFIGWDESSDLFVLGTTTATNTTTGSLSVANGGLQISSIDAGSDNFTLNTSGTISIGNDSDNANINIGTAGNRTITLGHNSNSGGVTLHGASFSGETSLGGGSIIVVENGSTIAASADVKFGDTAATSGTADEMYNTKDIFTVASRNIMNLDARGLDTTDGTASNTGTMNIKSGSGGIAMTSAGTGDITLNSDDTLLLDSDGVLELNSSAGEISIGNDDVNQNINIGILGTRTITVGASSGSQSLNIASHDLTSNGLKLGGTLVTSSAVELNQLDGFRTATGDVQGQLDKLQAQIDAHAGAPNAFWVHTDSNLDHIAFASSDYTHFYTSIQSAIDAAKTNPRGISADPVIYVLSGSHTTQSSNVGLTIPATYTGGSGQTGYESGDTFHCSIVGIDPEGKAEISLDFANATTGQTDIGIVISNGSSNVTIKNLTITNCFKGISCSTSYTGNLKVENVKFTKCGWNGTAAGSESASAYDTMYDSNAVDDGGALRVESSGKCEVYDCDVETCNNGLFVVSNNGIIRDNRVKDTLGVGIRMVSCKNSEITTNIVDGAKNNGIRMEHCYNCFIKSNTVSNTYNGGIACFYNVNDQILNNILSECNQKNYNGAGGASATSTANQQVYDYGQIYIAGSVVSQASSDGATSGLTYKYTVHSSSGVSGLTSQADLFNKSQATIHGNVMKNCYAGRLQTINSNAGSTVGIYLNSDIELGCLIVNNTALNPLAYSTDYDVGGTPVDSSASNAYLVVSNHGANAPAVLINNNVGHGFTELLYDAASSTSSAAQVGVNMLLTNAYTEQNLPTVS